MFGRARLIRWAIYLVLLLVLEVSSKEGWINPLVWVAPTDVLRGLADPVLLTSFLDEALYSLRSVILAIVCCGALGIILGVVLARAPRAYLLLEPYLESYYAVPLFAFYPVAIGLVGVNVVSSLIIAFLWALGAVLINTVVGVRSVDAAFIKYSESLVMSRAETLRHVTLPAAFPRILTGLKIGFAYSVVGVIGAEFLLSTRGVGHLIDYYYNNFQTQRMYGAMLLLVVGLLVILKGFELLEGRVYAQRGLARNG